MTSLNVADQSTINLGVSLPFNIKKWWSVYLSVNAFHQSYIANDDKFTAVSQTTGSFYAQNSFLVKGGFKFEVSGWFSTPSIWGGTFRTRSMGSLDLAVEKKFMKEKLSLRLAASDIFFTSFWIANGEFSEITVNGSGGYESRRVTLSLSYNFGNSEVKKARDRKTGLEDEDKRTGGQ
jgi:hypothetical protein